MALEAGYAPKVGDRFAKTYKGTTYIAEAVEIEIPGVGEAAATKELRIRVHDTEADGKDQYGHDVLKSATGKTTDWKTLGTAGTAIQRHAVVATQFWSKEGEEPVKAPKAEKPAKEPKAEKVPGEKKSRKTKAADGAAGEAPQPEAKTMQVIKQARSQKGVTDGQTRWYCNACAEGFEAATGTAPTACPKGHPATVTEGEPVTAKAEDVAPAAPTAETVPANDSDEASGIEFEEPAAVPAGVVAE